MSSAEPLLLSCCGTYYALLLDDGSSVTTTFITRDPAYSAETDHTFPLEARRKAEDMLVANKATYFIQVFGSVQHGFALRADPSVPVQSKCAHVHGPCVFRMAERWLGCRIERR